MHKGIFIGIAALVSASLYAYGAAYEIRLNPGESLTLGDIQVKAVPAPPCPECPPVTPCPECPPVVPCPDCPACPECPECPEPPPVIPPTQPPSPVGVTPLGVNLPGPDDWNGGARAKLFVDVMKTAREIAPNRWRVLTTSNNQEKSLNWSTSGSRQPKITGTYLLSWSGGGTVTASGATVKNATASTADIVITADNVDVDIQFSAPATNIVLLRPGYPRGTTQTVTNEFKAFVAPFSHIRFMDVQNTNWDFGDNATYATDAIKGMNEYIAERTKNMTGAVIAQNVPVQINGVIIETPITFRQMNWADRPPDNSQTYHRMWGISAEMVIRIANECKKDVWFCIWPNANDDCITGLANLAKTKLDPSLKFMFEIGNENPWNDIAKFGQSKIIIAQARAAVVSDPFIANPSENAWYLGARYVAKRTVESSRIFRQVFGADYNARIRPIFSSQHTNPSYIGNAMNWVLRKYGNTDDIHGIACAPYIGASVGTPDEIIATLKSDIAGRDKPAAWLAFWRGVADAYQKKLYFYEGGIDMSQETVNLQNRIAAAYDPRMRDVVRLYLENSYDVYGGTAMAYFNGVSTRDKWGPAWGLTDDIVDMTQPMYVGARTFALTAAPTGGVTATFYKDTNFTTPLGTIVVPVVNHAWQNWGTGPIYGRKDLLTTQAADGSIRFTGRLLSAGALTVEKETNDAATLMRNGDAFRLDYVAAFGGNGTAWVRLMIDGKPGRQAQYMPN